MLCCFFRCPSRYLFDEDTLRCQRESRVNCRKFTFNSSQFAKDNVLVVLEQFLEPFFNTPLSYRAAQTMYPQGWRLFQSVIFLPEKISLWCEKKYTALHKCGKYSRDHLIFFHSTGVRVYNGATKFQPSTSLSTNEIPALKFQLVCCTVIGSNKCGWSKFWRSPTVLSRCYGRF